MKYLYAIRDKWLEQTLLHPDKVYEKRGQKVYRRRVDRGRHVMEAVVDDLRFPNVVVTLYFVN